jgi:hypothetical protein
LSAVHRDLDALIRAARPAEEPSVHDRALVRRGLDLRIAPGSPPSEAALDGVLSIGAPVLVLVVSFAALLGLSGDSPLRAPSLATPAPPAHEQPLQSAPPTTLDDEAALKDNAESLAAPPLPERASSAANVATPAVSATARVDRPAALASAANAGNLAAESRALMEVQRALRAHQPDRALLLLTEQDRQFAHGALLEERAAASVFARCARGDRDAARRAALAFAVRYPGSPLKSRVLASCADAAEIDPPRDGTGQ